MKIKRCYPVLVGATVNANQLVPNGNFSDGLTGWNFPSATATISDGACEVSLDYITQHQIYVNVPQKVQNHKVLITYTAQGSAAMDMSINWGVTLIPTHRITDTKINYAHIATVGSGNTNLVFLVTSEIGDKIKLSNINLIDLTAMFGSTIADYLYSLETATAGAGIAKLREWGFLGGYKAYNAGSLESVEVTGKKVVGFNAWDEEWELGYYNLNTGAPVAGSANIRSKNFISVLPNTTYHVTNPVGSYVVAHYYDADKNFIKNDRAIINQNIITPSNCHYMRIHMTSGYGTTYNHDICINLSNPDRNGEYEPYKSITYELGDDVLRGLFKLDASNNLYADGDRKTADGIITRRYGTRAYQEGDESLSDAITDGTITVYKLLTPTTETSTPFTSPQIVYPDGTEEFVTENGVPVGHETEYQL